MLALREASILMPIKPRTIVRWKRGVDLAAPLLRQKVIIAGIGIVLIATVLIWRLASQSVAAADAFSLSAFLADQQSVGCIENRGYADARQCRGFFIPLKKQIVAEIGALPVHYTDITVWRDRLELFDKNTYPIAVQDAWHIGHHAHSHPVIGEALFHLQDELAILSDQKLDIAQNWSNANCRALSGSYSAAILYQRQYYDASGKAVPRQNYPENKKLIFTSTGTLCGTPEGLTIDVTIKTEGDMPTPLINELVQKGMCSRDSDKVHCTPLHYELLFDPRS